LADLDPEAIVVEEAFADKIPQELKELYKVIIYSQQTVCLTKDNNDKIVVRNPTKEDGV